MSKDKTEFVEVRRRFLHNQNVMDYLVVTCILSILAYTSYAMYHYYKIDSPPPELLTQLFFAFFGGELLAMAGITISKHSVNKKLARSIENEEEEE